MKAMSKKKAMKGRSYLNNACLFPCLRVPASYGGISTTRVQLVAAFHHGVNLQIIINIQSASSLNEP